MKKKNTYKQRLRILGIATVIFALLVYNMAIKSTVESVRACNNMEDKLEHIDEAPVRISLLKERLKELDGIIDKRDTSRESEIRETLLEKTSIYCNNNYGVTLTEFSEPVYHEFKNYQVETNIIIMEGMFKELLKFAYLVEQKYKTGKPISVRFHTERDFIKKTRKLYLTLYIQNLKKTF